MRSSVYQYNVFEVDNVTALLGVYPIDKFAVKRYFFFDKRYYDSCICICRDMPRS